MSDMAEIKQALDSISSQVKEEAAKALSEAKKGVEMAQGQKERVDELLLKQGELQQQMKAAEQALAALKESGAGPDLAALKSAGYQVIEGKGFKESIEGLKSRDRKNVSWNSRMI